MLRPHATTGLLVGVSVLWGACAVDVIGLACASDEECLQHQCIEGVCRDVSGDGDGDSDAGPGGDGDGDPGDGDGDGDGDPGDGDGDGDPGDGDGDGDGDPGDGDGDGDGDGVPCGNGIVDDGEDCDRGALNSDEPNALCRSDCQDPRCGDGILDDATEACDPPGPMTQCGFGCFSFSCGDGQIQGQEGCDEAFFNSNAPDADCRQNCQPQRCGDGITDPGAGEVCDSVVNLGLYNGCDPGCGSRPRHCGDGTEDPEEVCDLGPENGAYDGACAADCQGPGPFCGDGQRNGPEVCDDGTNMGGYGGCLPGCAALGPFCGDGNLDAPQEVCDEGMLNGIYEGACASDCQGPGPFCGDGNRDVSDEACDDGINDGSYNGCDPGCQTLPIRCGDDVIQAGQGEICDGDTLPALVPTCLSFGYLQDPTFDEAPSCADDCQGWSTNSCGWEISDGFEIEEAFEHAALLPGHDVIRLNSGTLPISSSVDIHDADPNGATLEPAEPGGVVLDFTTIFCFDISTSNHVFRGLVFEDADEAFCLSGDGIEIRDNLFINDFDNADILVDIASNASGTVVESNLFLHPRTGGVTAIGVGGDNVTIERNVMLGELEAPIEVAAAADSLVLRHNTLAPAAQGSDVAVTLRGTSICAEGNLIASGTTGFDVPPSATFDLTCTQPNLSAAATPCTGDCASAPHLTGVPGAPVLDGRGCLPAGDPLAEAGPTDGAIDFTPDDDTTSFLGDAGPIGARESAVTVRYGNDVSACP